MSSLSLNASIRTCKVEAGEAVRIESDRFLDPSKMVCIPWNGYNSKGQAVCPDSWNTMTPGCRSAMDRVGVENHHRPHYASMINLNTAGIYGDIYNPTAWKEAGQANLYAESRDKLTGSFGNQWQSTNYGSCGMNAYENAMAQVSQSNHQASFTNNAYQQNSYQQAAGNRGSCGH